VDFPAASDKETQAMFAKAATRVGFAYAVSLVILTALLHAVA